jgi:hypothetical protein
MTVWTKTKSGLEYEVRLTDPVSPVGVQHSKWMLRTLRLECEIAGGYRYISVLRFRCDRHGGNLEIEPLDGGMDSHWIDFNNQLESIYSARLPKYMGVKNPSLDEVHRYRLAICDVLDNLHRYKEW